MITVEVLTTNAVKADNRIQVADSFLQICTSPNNSCCKAEHKTYALRAITEET